MVFYKKLTTSLKINKIKKTLKLKAINQFCNKLIKINKKEEEAKLC